MDIVSHLNPSNTTTKVRAILGEKLSSIYPKNLTKTLFTLNGAGANEVAIMIARLYTNKRK